MPGEFYIEGKQQRVNLNELLAEIAELEAKVDSVVVYRGVTTAIGAPDGSTLICSDLMTRANYNGSLVVVLSGDCAGQARSISASTVGGTVIADAPFDSRIPAGVNFAIISARIPGVPKLLSSLDLWSDFTTPLIVGTAPTNQNLPSITIAGIPNGATLVRACMLLKFRALHDNSGSDNALNGNQVIQAQKAVGGSWITGINLVDGQLTCLADSRDTGDVLVGQVDIKDQVPANGQVINFRWNNSLALGNSLVVEDVQVGLRLFF